MLLSMLTPFSEGEKDGVTTDDVEATFYRCSLMTVTKILFHHAGRMRKVNVLYIGVLYKRKKKENTFEMKAKGKNRMETHLYVYAAF